MYFLLAAFDVFAISASLYLNHRITDEFAASVVVNREWTERLRDYSELSQLASAVNAPGNNVFASLAPDEEEAALRAAATLFDLQLAEARADLRAEGDIVWAPRLLAHLDSVDLAMDAMVTEATAIFDAFREGDQTEAGARMAAMDSRFATVIDSIDSLRGQVLEIQQTALAAQSAEADSLRRFEALIGALILLMVVGVAVYGYSLTKSLEAQAVERGRYEERLREAKTAAESASRAKSAFLATMSHELRTPLTAITGYSELLQEEMIERDCDDLLPDLHRIRAASDHLLGLVNNVLDVTQIEAGRMPLDLGLFDVESLVSGVATTVESLVQRHDNELVVSVAPGIGSMRSDEVKVRQILFNLLANAAKFTSNGTIRLDADRVRKETGDWVRFTVHDTGDGIPEEQLPHVFEEFTQADNSQSRRHEGSGLGLAITRRLVHILDGHVEVDSSPLGTCFVITLPAEMEDHLDAPSEV